MLRAGYTGLISKTSSLFYARKNTINNGKYARLHRTTKKAKTYLKRELFGMKLYFAFKYITNGKADYLRA